MTSRMPERARTNPWELQGSNPLGPPGPELGRFFPLRLCGATVHQELSDSGQLNQIRDQSYR